MIKDTLLGKRILIVEDSALLALDLAKTLQSHGAIVVGPAYNLTLARSLLAEQAPDVVVLDLNLCGELAIDLACEMKNRALPFVMLTGYQREALVPSLCAEVPCLEKPMQESKVIRALCKVLGRDSP